MSESALSARPDSRKYACWARGSPGAGLGHRRPLPLGPGRPAGGPRVVLELCREWATEMRPRRRARSAAPTSAWPDTGGASTASASTTPSHASVSRPATSPPCGSNPRAEYLHAEGPEAVVATIRALLKSDLGDVHFSVSRVDLFADWQGWALALDDAHSFSSAGPTPGGPTRSVGPSRASSSAAARRRRSRPASTTRRPTSPSRAVTGGSRSGASGTCPVCPSIGSCSRSVARLWSSSTSTRRPRSSLPRATCGSTAPGTG